MTLLILGVALFALLHLIPIFAIEARQSVKSRIGEKPYKGLFALAVLASVYFIYKGWTATEVDFLYIPPSWSGHLAALFILAGFITFFASRAPTNIKRILRNPQLTGVVLWSAGHLIANGETRSIVLFAGLGLWALIAIIGTNKRDGDWVKPEKQPVIKDVVTVLIGVALYGVFAFWAHEFLFGVRPIT